MLILEAKMATEEIDAYEIFNISGVLENSL